MGTGERESWSAGDAAIWAAIAAAIGNGNWYALPAVQRLVPAHRAADVARVVELAVRRHLLTLDRSRTPVRYQLAS